MSGDFQATEKLKLNAGITYNNAEDSWDWSFVERMALGVVTIRGTTPVGTAYDTSEQNNLIDTYSDLSYEQYQFTVGGTYDFTETFFTTASFTYDIFDAQETYVYGDEDGTAYYGYAGLGWRF